MSALLKLATALAVLAMSAVPVMAQSDEFDAEIVTGCHFAMGEWGNAGIQMCIEANRQARREVEAMPAEYDEYRVRCIRRRELGWSVVKECIEDDVAAALALKNLSGHYDEAIKGCTRRYRYRGPAAIKDCVDGLVAADGGCPGEEEITAYLADYQAARPSEGFGREIGLRDAQCARSKLVARMAQLMGAPIGYKAAFTSPALQRTFGVSGPEWGAMFGGMMLASGARLPAKFGARPLQEADFVAVARGPGLADAMTPLEALQHLSEVVPFIELPDLMVEGAPTGPGLIAINVGFRGGVLGRGVPVQPTQAFLDALAGMQVVMTEDVSGRELGRAEGSAIMGNPVVAAMWLARTLREQGVELKAGDLLSLGGYLPPSPVQPGTRITVRYLGLPGDPSVTAQFE
jgi:2-keto-4-pentenoate hydratase